MLRKAKAAGDGARQKKVEQAQKFLRCRIAESEKVSMTWYAAHLILFVRFKERRQTRFPVWENIVLIQADSEEEALVKAEKRGRQDEGDSDGTFQWEGHLAEWVFAGVRQLILCQDENRRPGDGTEVTYLEMEVASEEALRKLAAGEQVSVRLEDCLPREPFSATSSERPGKDQNR